MQILIDTALKTKLESIHARIDTAIYSSPEDAFRRYVSNKKNKVELPFFTYISTNMELDIQRYNRPFVDRGIPGPLGVLGDGSTQDTTSRPIKKILPVIINYRISALVKRRGTTKYNTRTEDYDVGLYDVEKSLFFWLAGSNTLDVVLFTGETIGIPIEMNFNVDESTSPQLTIEEYERGKYCQASMDLIVKAWLQKDDTAVKTILKLHGDIYDILYDGDEVDLDNSILMETFKDTT